MLSLRADNYSRPHSKTWALLPPPRHSGRQSLKYGGMDLPPSRTAEKGSLDYASLGNSYMTTLTIRDSSSMLPSPEEIMQEGRYSQYSSIPLRPRSSRERIALPSIRQVRQSKCAENIWTKMSVGSSWNRTRKPSFRKLRVFIWSCVLLTHRKQDSWKPSRAQSTRRI